MTVWRFLVLSTALGWLSCAEARIYNYEDMPVGPRSFGMGNTGMAIADDVGNVYFNPAVLSWSEGNQISASVSAYSRIDTRTGQYVSLFESAADNVTRGGFLSVPSTVGGFLAKEQWTWGGAVFVPSAFKSSGSLDLGTDRRASYESEFEDIWISAFASRQLDSRTSVGLALFYVSRLYNEKFTYLDKSGGTLDITFRELMCNVNGATAILGFSRKQHEKWMWGLSARLPVWQWGGKGNVSSVESGASDIQSSDFVPKGFPMPYRVSFGALYQSHPAHAWSADIHFYGALKQNLHPEKLAAFQIDLRSIANLHFGYEYFYKKSLGFRFGWYTNISAARVLPEEVSAIHDKVNMFGATGALVLAKDSGEVVLGAWAQGGQGRSRSVDPSDRGSVPRSNYFYGGVIASSYRF
jgi:hypothetical protein